MLTISPILNNTNTNYTTNNQKTELNINKREEINTKKYNPAYYMPVSFKQKVIPLDISHTTYLKLSPQQKQSFRTTYRDFYKLIDISELYWNKNRTPETLLPLYTDTEMKDFLEIAKSYNKYRGDKEKGIKPNGIICLGRSPKWFLNASLWMKNGIENYDFVAFSSNWYDRNYSGIGNNLYRRDDRVPTKTQEKNYRQYLKRIVCKPADIIQSAKDTGKPVVVTDYIHSGCGVTSWLDLMSRWAEEDGILDDFAKSIMLHTIGSNTNLEDKLWLDTNYAGIVKMPELLKNKSIQQKYYDMSAEVLLSMLIDKNTNECRSTFYPPRAWTIFSPDKFKIAQKETSELEEQYRYYKNFGGVFPDMDVWSDAMKDYRNMMNFRILDYRAEHGMLDSREIGD